MMEAYEQAVEISVAQEIAAEVLKAASCVMQSYGNTPNGGVIVATGFFLALQSIGKDIDAGVPATVLELLKANAGGPG